MMQQINLFNPALLPKKRYFSAKTILQSLFVLLLGMISMVAYAHWQNNILQAQVERNAKQLAKLDAQLASIVASMPKKEKNPQLPQEIAKVEQQVLALENLQGVLSAGSIGNATGYAQYMEALARQSLDGIWLTGFQFEGPGQSIEIAGRSMQANLVPKYMQKLSREASFHGKSFDSLEIKPVVLDEKEQAAARKSAQVEGHDENEARKSPYLEFRFKGGGAETPQANANQPGKGG